MRESQSRSRVCPKSESELRDILDQGGRMEYDSESHAKLFHLIVLYLHVCTIPMRSIMGQATAHRSQPSYFCSHGEDSSK